MTAQLPLFDLSPHRAAAPMPKPSQRTRRRSHSFASAATAVATVAVLEECDALSALDGAPEEVRDVLEQVSFALLCNVDGSGPGDFLSRTSLRLIAEGLSDDTRAWLRESDTRSRLRELWHAVAAAHDRALRIALKAA